MHKVWIWLKNEIATLTPVWIFFLFSFSLLKLTETTILYEIGIKVEGFHRIIIGTFLISKVFIVLDNLKFINLFKNRPLIYSILWKSFLYFIGSILVRYLDLQISDAKYTDHLKIGEPRFWMIQIWVGVLVFIFCSVREFIQTMGKDKFKKILFG